MKKVQDGSPAVLSLPSLILSYPHVPTERTTFKKRKLSSIERQDTLTDTKKNSFYRATSETVVRQYIDDLRAIGLQLLKDQKIYEGLSFLQQSQTAEDMHSQYIRRLQLNLPPVVDVKEPTDRLNTKKVRFSEQAEFIGHADPNVDRTPVHVEEMKMGDMLVFLALQKLSKINND